jgi:hypothetical protein
MSEKTVSQKLLIKPGYKVLFWRAPADYDRLLGDLPAYVMLAKDFAEPVDLIQVFAVNRKDLEDQLSQIKPVLRPETVLWVTYHKGTSKVKTDINRDTINAYAQTLGLQGVAMISVNDDWAALRLKFAR